MYVSRFWYRNNFARNYCVENSCDEVYLFN